MKEIATFRIVCSIEFASEKRQAWFGAKASTSSPLRLITREKKYTLDYVHTSLK